MGTQSCWVPLPQFSLFPDAYLSFMYLSVFVGLYHTLPYKQTHPLLNLLHIRHSYLSKSYKIVLMVKIRVKYAIDILTFSKNWNK